MIMKERDEPSRLQVRSATLVLYSSSIRLTNLTCFRGSLMNILWKFEGQLHGIPMSKESKKSRNLYDIAKRLNAVNFFQHKGLMRSLMR